MFSFDLVLLCFVIVLFQQIAGHNTTGRITKVFDAEKYDFNIGLVREQVDESFPREKFNISLENLNCSVNKRRKEHLNPKSNVKKRETLIDELLNRSLTMLEGVSVRDEKMKITFKGRSSGGGITRVTTPKEHPHAVLIALDDSSTPDPKRVGVCSGSLVTLQWVLTVAHCFTVDYKFIHVYAGGNSLKELATHALAMGSQRQLGSEVYRHPKYDPLRKAYYDVALIQLFRTGFDQSESVKPVVLSLNFWGNRTCEKGTLTDFGPEHDDHVGYEDVSLFSRNTHFLEIDSSCKCFDQSRKKLMLCSKIDKTVYGGICSAVSGGGLICDGKLVGVAAGYQTVRDINTCAMDSAVTQSCTKHQETTFTTFHKICPYIPWINSHIEGIGSQCYELPKGKGNNRDDKQDGKRDGDRSRESNKVDTTTSNILIVTFSLQLLFLTVY